MFNDNHPDIVKTKFAIALCLHGMNMTADAFNILVKVEKCQLEMFGELHPEVVKTKEKIQEIHREMNSQKKCLLM